MGDSSALPYDPLTGDVAHWTLDEEFEYDDETETLVEKGGARTFTSRVSDTTLHAELNKRVEKLMAHLPVFADALDMDAAEYGRAFVAACDQAGVIDDDVVASARRVVAAVFNSPTAVGWEAIRGWLLAVHLNAASGSAGIEALGQLTVARALVERHLEDGG